MANLKPIETIYNGVKFRSKLEAQWALFFDLIGAQWEYEPQSFKLSSGEVYVPDFIIRDVRLVHWGDSENPHYEYPLRDVYVEVKPVNYDSRIHKAFQFIDDNRDLARAGKDYSEYEWVMVPGGYRYPLYFVGPMPVYDISEMWQEAYDDTPFYGFFGIDGDEEMGGLIGISNLGQIGIFGSKGCYRGYMDQKSTMSAFEVVRRHRFFDFNKE